MTHEQDCASIFGERARHSEFSIGQVVRSLCDDRVQTGEITWITPAQADHPLEYWIGLNCLYQGDILGLLDDDEGDEPVLVLCPYCRRTHSPEAIEWCRKRNRGQS
jgi:hypothetical protein